MRIGAPRFVARDFNPESKAKSPNVNGKTKYLGQSSSQNRYEVPSNRNKTPKVMPNKRINQPRDVSRFRGMVNGEINGKAEYFGTPKRKRNGMERDDRTIRRDQ